jgi:hypothetical protein
VVIWIVAGLGAQFPGNVADQLDILFWRLGLLRVEVTPDLW